MNANPFHLTGPLLNASILAADFAHLGDEIESALRFGADTLHLDVMDGHLVPNISFGTPIIAAVRTCTSAFLDVHLMIDEPVRYARSMIEAGAQSLTIHIESPQVRVDPVRAMKTIRDLGCHVGVTLKPGTAVEALEPVLAIVDMVLVMSVEPGFGGQSFMPTMLDKVRWLKARLRADQRIQIDGGISAKTIQSARAAGVDWFVVGSALFGPPDRAATIAELRRLML